MGHVILGLFITAFGAVLVIKAFWVYQLTGPISWAEAHLGASGGTKLMYQLIGILICIIGFMVMTNLWQGIIKAVFSSIIPGGG